MRRIREVICFVATVFAITIDGPVNAQARSRFVIVQSGDDYVETNVLPKVHATTGEKNLTYFWFRGNQIHSTIGAYDSNVLHGKYAAYYPNKDIKELGVFSKGLKTGVWESWYESGLRDEVITMKDGRRNGLYRKYNDQGILILEGTYKDGMLHGHLITYHLGKELLRRKYRNGEEIIEEEQPENIVPRKRRFRNIWPFNKPGDTKPKRKPVEDNPADDEPKKT